MLAHALLARGYRVTVATNKRPDEIASGRILSNQCMWHDAIEIERRLGLALWDDTCPPIPGFDTSVIDAGGRVDHRFVAPLSHPGQSVDQRLKFSHWMRLFGDRGGELVYLDADTAVLEDLAAANDLVVVAAGRGKRSMKGFFEIDPARSISTEPERIGASVHVKGRQPDASHEPELEGWAVIPGVGEFWIIPTLTVHGPGHILCLQAIPGGPLDRWAGLHDGAAHLEAMLETVRTWLPEEAERCRNVALVDPLAWLSGGVVSTVTKPVHRLPSGRYVLAMADSFVFNDPISQQGSNNATRAAWLFAREIHAHGERSFDAEWMRRVCALYWKHVRWSAELTRLYLRPTRAFHRCFELAAGSPERARWLADSNNDVVGFLTALGYSADGDASLPTCKAVSPGPGPLGDLQPAGLLASIAARA